jgi:hypothetical protein
VGCFIKRRAFNSKDQRQQEHVPGFAAPAGDSSTDTTATSTAPGGNRNMLYRKLVYSNKKGKDATLPKLALFAATNIEPNTELFM